MKLKNATQLAIIGVILQLIIRIIYGFRRMNILVDIDWYVLDFINFIGIALLLPFFITLFKSQK